MVFNLWKRSAKSVSEETAAAKRPLLVQGDSVADEANTADTTDAVVASETRASGDDQGDDRSPAASGAAAEGNAVERDGDWDRPAATHGEWASDGEAVDKAVDNQPGPRGLAASDLSRRVDVARLAFTTTADLEPASGLIGQERALKAIAFGVGVKARDFNVFVLGPPAAGKSTAVRTYLQRTAGAASSPRDWVYVNNFADPSRPKALSLPHGRAQGLAKGMIAAIDELRDALPVIFESEDYAVRRRAIEEEARSGQEAALEALNRKAAEQNIAVLRTPMGFAMAPMHEGKVVKPEVFAGLPEAMRRGVEAKIEALQDELAELLSQAPRVEKARRARVAALNEEFARRAARAAFDDIEPAHRDLPEVMAFLAAAEEDLVRNAGMFFAHRGEDGTVAAAPVEAGRDPRFRRYMVNVMAGPSASGTAGPAGAPIVEEQNPTHGNLIGRIEHIAQMGALVTDFLLLKPGALHRANGGTLLLDARKLITTPFAWDALKRALRAGEIRLESPAEQLGLVATETLAPDPIPLDVKVVLFGERELYYMLAAYDPDFQRLFQVQADFDDVIERTAENEDAYARLVAAIVAAHGARPVEAAGVARLIEEAARLAADREKLSIEIGRIADIVREADYWAGDAASKTVRRQDVQRAIQEHVQRSDRLRDRAQETIGRGIVLVDTAGEKVGQVNGLSVVELGNFAFGRPSRITARVRMGAGRVTDIEREAKLGGALHSKGVMILWGYLAGRYAETVPLSLAASLVFEQSYGGVDGDSASSAELYAILSALAEAPLRQGLAVTGSVNQWGEVQAIGGVNEKIEGFFDICRERGLDGRQGVLIPVANVQHLMLRDDVVSAVAEGRFAVYAVATVDEGIALLTGLPAGARGAEGQFPAGTVNRRVEDRLIRFAEGARRFGVSSDGVADAGRSGAAVGLSTS